LNIDEIIILKMKNLLMFASVVKNKVALLVGVYSWKTGQAKLRPKQTHRIIAEI